MTTASAIRAQLRKHDEVELGELAYLVGKDERDVRAALDSLAGEVEVDHAGFVSLVERQKASTPRRPREIGPASVRPAAERRARTADEIPSVVAYREVELGGELVEDPADWIEQLEGAPPYTRTLEYVRPGSEWIATAGTSSGDALDRLRMLSEMLARRFGWVPAVATTFVLTGWTPPLSIGRATEPQVSTVSGPLPPAPAHERLIGDADRAARASVGTSERASADIAAKYPALIAFVAERRPAATWDEVLVEWNHAHRARPAWHYSRRDKLAAAYRHALAASASRSRWPARDGPANGRGERAEADGRLA